MKKSLIILALALFTTGAISAQSTGNSGQSKGAYEAEQQPQKTKIMADKLPEKVKVALDGDKYAGWEVKESFEVKAGEDKTYEVVLTNGEKDVTYEFDSEGNVLI